MVALRVKRWEIQNVKMSIYFTQSSISLRNWVLQTPGKILTLKFKLKKRKHFISKWCRSCRRMFWNFICEHLPHRKHCHLGLCSPKSESCRRFVLTSWCFNISSFVTLLVIAISKPGWSLCLFYSIVSYSYIFTKHVSSFFMAFTLNTFYWKLLIGGWSLKEIFFVFFIWKCSYDVWVLFCFAKFEVFCVCTIGFSYLLAYSSMYSHTLFST